MPFPVTGWRRLGKTVLLTLGLGSGCFLGLPRAAATERPLPPFLAEDTPGVLTVAPHLDLAGVDDREIALTGEARPLGSWSPALADPGLGPWRVQVVREVSALWRLRLAAESFEPPVVRVEMIAPDGTPNTLRCEGRADSRIRVRARALPPEVVDRSADTVVVEGGVELTLDISHARVAGRYSGTLLVTLHQF